MDNNIINEQNTEAQDSLTAEISVLDIIALVIRNWWIVAMVGAIFGIAVYAYTKTTSVPTYRSSGNIYIDTQREQKTDDVNATALMNAQDLMPTYIEILKSRSFCSQISDSIDNKYSYKEIMDMLTLVQKENTNIMTISVTCIDEQDSYTLCSNIVDKASDEILRVFEGGSVKIIDRPEAEPTEIVANAYKRGAVGFVLGAAIAIFILFLFNMFDTRIETSDELTSKYNLPILGEAPNLGDVS